MHHGRGCARICCSAVWVRESPGPEALAQRERAWVYFAFSRKQRPRPRGYELRRPEPLREGGFEAVSGMVQPTTVFSKRRQRNEVELAVEAQGDSPTVGLLWAKHAEPRCQLHLAALPPLGQHRCWLDHPGNRLETPFPKGLDSPARRLARRRAGRRKARPRDGLPSVSAPTMSSVPTPTTEVQYIQAEGGQGGGGSSLSQFPVFFRATTTTVL